MQRMKEKRELKAGEKYGTYRLAFPVKFYDNDGNVKPDPNAPWIKGDATETEISGCIDFEADAVKPN